MCEPNAMREQVQTKIKAIYENEKFKMDGYFLCGFPSGIPSEKLIRACEAYLNGGTQPSREAAEALIAELESVLASKAKSTVADHLVDNTDDLRAVLAHKELLLD